jgi:signal transduction histidine kinase
VLVLPFALLAGLRRFRLLQVELYAARAVAYAVVLVVVVGAYAGAAAVLGRRSVAAAVLVAVVAALTGRPLQAWLERHVDRVLSGGRIRGHALVRHLAESLGTAEPQRVAARTAETVAAGLDVSWVAITSAVATAHAGTAPQGPAQVTVPLVAGDQDIGTIACGPRRGGWAADDVRLLELLGRHAGLALHGAELSAALAAQVAELTASRERLVRAEDDTRRRIERDLHDGIQQQVVGLLGRLGLLRSQLDAATAPYALAAQSHDLAQRVLEELRQLVRGIHPPLLTDRGLVAAVEAQADLLTLPVAVDVDPRLERQRFAVDVETAAYYVVSEAITNVLKHSGAGQVRIVLTPHGEAGLQVAVVDDGIGLTPAPTEAGSGLRGLRDRVEAVGGVLDVSATDGVGTTVVARFPARVPAGA